MPGNVNKPFLNVRLGCLGKFFRDCNVFFKMPHVDAKKGSGAVTFLLDTIAFGDKKDLFVDTFGKLLSFFLFWVFFCFPLLTELFLKVM